MKQTITKISEDYESEMKQLGKNLSYT